MNTGLKTAVAVVALAAAVGVGAWLTGGDSRAGAQATPAAPGGPSDRASIDVRGHGKVEGTPDTMEITMGVETTDSSAQNAMNRNNQRAQAMIDALKAQGVAAKDIQTADLSVYPTYDDKQHVTGYTASNTIVAKLRNIAKAGAVIDAAAETAGDDIRLQGVTFSIDNTSNLVAQARAKAVKDAIAQANQLADAGNVKLGAIHTIDNTGTSYEPQVYDTYRGAKIAAADAAAPVEPGTQQLSVDVIVSFDING